jgi:hypothetical protein
MSEERQPGTWLQGLDSRRGDEALAKKAVLRLYEITGRPVPKAIIWLDSPFAGLLADGYLHRTFGDSLFQGEAPLLLEQMMQDFHRWETRSCEGHYFPSPQMSVSLRKSGAGTPIQELPAP